MAGALAAGAAAPLGAQSLARLHLHRFTLAADQTTVATGQPFHLTLRVGVDEQVGMLENVQTPDLAGFEDLGDERSCVFTTGHGSECVETLTLDAKNPGDQTLGPFTMEFVDATNGKTRTIESNVVTIHVTGAPATPQPAAEDDTPDPLRQIVWAAFWWFFKGVLTLCLVAVAAYALVWGFRRRRPLEPPAAPAPAPVAPPDPAPPVDWSARMRELGAQLASDPTRGRAVAVRAELRAHLGAGERETIADLVRRNAGGSDGLVMPALAAVERAAFCDDADVAHAAQEAVPFLTR